MWASPPPPPPVRKAAPHTRVLVTTIVLMAAALVALVAANSGSGARRAARLHRSSVVFSGTSLPPASPTTVAPSTTIATTTTTTLVAPTPLVAGGPVLTAISPASGGPGQTVTIHGANLISGSGLITLSFAGTTAPVSCGTPTECVGSVPSGIAAPPSTPLPVTIATSAGPSKALPFLYTG